MNKRVRNFVVGVVVAFVALTGLVLAGSHAELWQAQSTFKEFSGEEDVLRSEITKEAKALQVTLPQVTVVGEGTYITLRGRATPSLRNMRIKVDPGGGRAFSNLNFDTGEPSETISVGDLCFDLGSRFYWTNGVNGGVNDDGAGGWNCCGRIVRQGDCGEVVGSGFVLFDTGVFDSNGVGIVDVSGEGYYVQVNATIEDLSEGSTLHQSIGRLSTSLGDVSFDGMLYSYVADGEFCIFIDEFGWMCRDVE